MIIINEKINKINTLNFMNLSPLDFNNLKKINRKGRKNKIIPVGLVRNTKPKEIPVNIGNKILFL
tara:strand:+ start:471 stop:665 length:195 start_codon:yes stop_codon:yes gene_type:complete